MTLHQLNITVHNMYENHTLNERDYKEIVNEIKNAEKEEGGIVTKNNISKGETGKRILTTSKKAARIIKNTKRKTGEKITRNKKTQKRVKIAKKKN